MGASNSKQYSGMIESCGMMTIRFSLKYIGEKNIGQEYYIFFKPNKKIKIKSLHYFSLYISKNNKLIEKNRIDLTSLTKMNSFTYKKKIHYEYIYMNDNCKINFKINENNELYKISYVPRNVLHLTDYVPDSNEEYQL